MLALRNIVAPISALVWPAAARRATVSCCAVRSQGVRRPGSRTGRRWPRSSMRARRANAGSLSVLEELAGPGAGARARRGVVGRAAATRRTGGEHGRARCRGHWRPASRARPGSGVRHRARRAPGNARATPLVHVDPLTDAIASRRATCTAASSACSLRHAASMKSGQLERGDLEEGIVDQRFEPVVGLLVAGFGEVPHGECGLAGGSDAAESHRGRALADHLDLRARGVGPGQQRDVDDVLGVVPDGAPQLAHLLDVLVGPAGGSAGQLGQRHGPQRGVQQLQRPRVARRRGGAFEALASRRGVPQGGGEGDADRAVREEVRWIQRQDRVDGGPHDGHRLLVGEQDVGAEAAEDGAGRTVVQLRALAHPGTQLGQGGALGQSFRRQRVLERLDQGTLLEGDVVAVEGLGRRQHVGSGLHERRVRGEDGDAGAGPDQTSPGHRVQHLLVHVVEVGLGQLGRTRRQCRLRCRDEARELQLTDRGQGGGLGQEPRP